MEKDRLEVKLAMERAVLPLSPGDRIGLLGGTFDPVHNGHIALADGVAKKLRLDSLLFMPAALNPFKRKQKTTSFVNRVAMLDLAVKKRPEFFVSVIEGRRQPPSFTIDTVREYRQVLGSSPELFLIVGSDAFIEIDKWKEGKSILQHASIVVVQRPPVSLREFSAMIPPLFPTFFYDTDKSAWTDAERPGRIFLLDLPLVDVSSTMVRKKVFLGGDVRHLVDPDVAAYMAEHNLFQAEKTG